MIYKHKYGLCKKYPTEHAILQLVNYISSALDNRKFALGVFWVKIWIKRSMQYVMIYLMLNLKDMEWMVQPLLGSVIIYFIENNMCIWMFFLFSGKAIILYGVPQGSILEPLFLIYNVSSIMYHYAIMSYQFCLRMIRIS